VTYRKFMTLLDMLGPNLWRKNTSFRGGSRTKGKTGTVLNIMYV
jgi:hypothetical protein